MPFEGFDFTGFWDDCDYAKKEYVSPPPTDTLIASIEEELGYKLPQSYIWLMKRHNGGIPAATCFPTNAPTSWAEDHVAISGIFGIGRNKDYALCGGLGSQFMIDEWEYPPIGVAVCDCPSAGHDMIFLDYRECGPQGEPKVVHVDQECDYRITPLAENFEAFIRGLVNEEAYEEDGEERKNEELKKVRTASFSNLLESLCNKSGAPEHTGEWIRSVAEKIVEEKGFFALHDDDTSMLLYDIQFWLYQNAFPDTTEESYLADYPKIIALDGGFCTGGFAPAFVSSWLQKREAEGMLLKQGDGLLLAGSAEAALVAKRERWLAEQPADLLEKISRWHDLDQHQMIVDAVLALPEAERSDDLLARLAVAYNNLNQYDKAVEILEELRPLQENTPRFHYRLGYALCYSGRYPEAREAFTRALVLNPPEEIAEDCRLFLDWIAEDYQQGEEYAQRKEACAGTQPELYTEKEMEAVENHIVKTFGAFENVWHELLSPDIHVDICVIPPTKERDYYTLTTMGMGAHQMAVPKSLAEYALERAELVICLPPSWKLGATDERWYWPVRLLKQLARLPGECDTWLGWGHTVDNQEPYAENTGLCGALLINPQHMEEEAQSAVLPSGEPVRFYQVIPLYREEMEFKQAHDADALLKKLAHNATGFVVDPERCNVCRGAGDSAACEDNTQAPEARKMFYLKNEDIKPLLTHWDGPEGCIATDRITVDGCKVGYCYREEPDGEFPDSGWRFTAGEESDEYMDDPDNAGIYTLNTICNYDPDVLPLLNAPYGTAFIRKEDGVFQQDAYEPREENEGMEPPELALAIMEYLNCPCRYFPPMEDDNSLMAAYHDAKERGQSEGFVPILTAVDETLWECLIMNTDEGSDGRENYAFDPESVAQYRKKMLSAPLKSGRVVTETLLKERKTEAEEDELNWNEEILGNVSGGAANDRFLGYWDYQTDRTLPLILAEIPVRHPWEVFAFLPFGNWNECPDTPELMAVTKYWFEQHGAEPAVITHDVLELTVSSPVDREQAVQLALEQYAFCPDVVDQGPEDATVGALADTLAQSMAWYFWWD